MFQLYTGAVAKDKKQQLLFLWEKGKEEGGKERKKRIWEVTEATQNKASAETAHTGAENIRLTYE